VLTFWEGLGYYRRARSLHRAARVIVQELDGFLPSDYHALRSLPGIGDYTASAIMSIAHDKPHPVIDANVRRVMRRVLALRNGSALAERRIRSWLETTIPRRNPGAFNEALMELGQTVCLIRRPLCDSCPVRTFCLALQRNLQERIPGNSTRNAIHKRSLLLLLVYDGKLLAKRKETGIFAGLWLLPTVPVSRKSVSEIDSFIHGTVAGVHSRKRALQAQTHHYTRYAELLMPAVYMVDGAQEYPGDGWKWLRLDRISRYPFPSTYRKIIDELRATRRA
jgi:A/G-specific adenine glycosylase